MCGRSSGAVSFADQQGYPTLAADDLDLATYFVRAGVADPVWQVDLGALLDVSFQVRSTRPAETADAEKLLGALGAPPGGGGPPPPTVTQLGDDRVYAEFAASPSARIL